MHAKAIQSAARCLIRHISLQAICLVHPGSKELASGGGLVEVNTFGLIGQGPQKRWRFSSVRKALKRPAIRFQS